MKRADVFFIPLLSFMGRVRAAVHDITFHLPHEHLPAQWISSSCSLQRVSPALAVKCDA